jgi:hypothetical protein
MIRRAATTTSRGDHDNLVRARESTSVKVAVIKSRTTLVVGDRCFDAERASDGTVGQPGA